MVDNSQTIYQVPQIAVVGLGYVGLPLAVALAQHYPVIGYDVNIERVNELKAGDDRTDEISRDTLLGSSLALTSDTAELRPVDVFIVAVPTPVDEQNKPDLEALKSASKMVGGALGAGNIVVFESTVYPGVTEEFVAPIIEKKSGLIRKKDFNVAYSPERINPGDKKHSISKVNKILAITTKKNHVKNKIKSVYSKVTKKLIITDNIENAETAKVIENIQRDLNIALMNEILLICKKLKINFSEVMRLARSKWNFLKFSPGLVGGHCLPVDPYYLSSIASRNRFKTAVTLSGRKVNDGMRKFVLNQLDDFIKKKKIKSIKFSKILIVGLSYKPGIADMRNSLNFKIYKLLLKNKLNVRGYDPYVKDNIKIKYKLINQIKNNNHYDVILFLSNHKHFEKEYKKLIKTKNKFKILDPFEYYS